MENFERLCHQGSTSEVCKTLGEIDGPDFVIRGGFAAGIMCENADRCGLGAYLPGLLNCFEMFIEIILHMAHY